MNEYLKTVIISYLTFFAKLRLKFFFKGKVIGVAGCYGKSSAVNLIEELIATEHKVLSTNSNGKGLNTESGIPFAILGIKPEKYTAKDWLNYSIQGLKNFSKPFDIEYFILEMGVDRPGDMKYLTKHFTPNIGILLNSNNTHSANFEDLHYETKMRYEDLIAIENGYILERAKDAIFYNLEDPEVVKQVNRFKGEKRFGYASDGNTVIKKFEQSLNGTLLKFEYKGKSFELNYKEPLLDEYQSTFELAIKIADYLDIKGENICKTFENLDLPAGRCSLFKGINGSYILDSSYNSSLVPASSALKLMAKIGNGRKIAILGDMRELGELAPGDHVKLAAIAAKYVDEVITVGPLMLENFVLQFEKLKKPSQKVHPFETTKEALQFVKREDYLKSEDLVLVKGSQNTLLLEIIVENLLADKFDVSKLCRRDSHYDEKRKELLQ